MNRILFSCKQETVYKFEHFIRCKIVIAWKHRFYFVTDTDKQLSTFRNWPGVVFTDPAIPVEVPE